jgi:ParB family chromosome partitioning protein
VAERPRGMGRGLAAILAISPQDGVEGLRDLPLDVIEPNRRQPRHRFDEESLIALAESIRLRGVLQPVLVRPLTSGHYELIAGERRWRAAKLAELERIPAIVRADQDAASLELALIENVLREDLNPVEEAQACAALVDELGLTREEVGVRVGRSRAAVSNLLRLLELPDEALELLQRGELTEGHGRALLLAADHEVRRRLAREAVAHGWSVRELERRARKADDSSTARVSPRRARQPPDASLHPDQEAAIAQIADTYGTLLGAEVAVQADRTGGYRVALTFASLEEALAAAHRLGAPAV